MVEREPYSKMAGRIVYRFGSGWMGKVPTFCSLVGARSEFWGEGGKPCP